jgi:regulator of protease activity HflC (stomatin/prohibitin superfamily)
VIEMAANIIIGFLISLVPIAVLYLLAGLKIVNEYERGVKFTLGKFAGIMDPGLRIVFPIIQSWRKIDIRTKVIDVPDQETITKDNVSVRINAVLYYKVTDSKKSVIEVRNFMYATSQLAQTTMRDIIGSVTLDELLSNREEISSKIQKSVDKDTDPWGIKIESVELKHVEIPGQMQRVMARQAEAERERRSVIIKSEGEVSAAKNLTDAAKNLTKFPGALHLRTLQSVNDLSSDKSNTIVYAVPKELLLAAKKIAGGKIK